MDMDDDCPVCKGSLQNPTKPISCCRKVFCQSCLKQAILARPQCPHCRSPIHNNADYAFRSAICPPGLPGGGAPLLTTQTVSSNLRRLLDQLQAGSAQASQMASAPNVSRSNPPATDAAVPPTAQSATRPLRRPVPRPRLYANNGVAPAVPVTPAPNPFIIQANTSPPPSVQSDDSDDMDDWEDLYIALTETGSNSGYILETYKCPYCPVGGLDDLELRDHCNDNHLNDRRQVVCPICVLLPHGNPTYYSRDFIGHLNLRHSYYINDITNTHRSDYSNMQKAILRSLHQT